MRSRQTHAQVADAMVDPKALHARSAGAAGAADRTDDVIARLMRRCRLRGLAASARRARPTAYAYRLAPTGCAGTADRGTELDVARGPDLIRDR